MRLGLNRASQMRIVVCFDYIIKRATLNATLIYSGLDIEFRPTLLSKQGELNVSICCYC